MVLRERRRLRAAFRVALAAVAAHPLLVACSSDKTEASADGGALDATAGDDVSEAMAVDTGGDAGTAADGLGGDANACSALIVPLDAAAFDAGPDADPCAVTLPCGLNKGLATSGCTVVMATADGAAIPDSAFGCQVMDDAGCTDDVYQPPASGGTGLLCPCELFLSGGRRPVGGRRVRQVRAMSRVGEYF